MTTVPTDLYIALTKLGVDDDRAVAVCQEVPEQAAVRIGAALRDVAKRWEDRIADVEQRLTALERSDGRP